MHLLICRLPRCYIEHHQPVQERNTLLIVFLVRLPVLERMMEIASRLVPSRRSSSSASLRNLKTDRRARKVL